MIAIVDYGVGNLFSLKSSLERIDADAVVTGDAEQLRRADKIILPGVGAFRDAIAKLRANGLDRVVISEARAGKPLLGICLGMQMLFDRSTEYGEHTGLGLIPGSVEALKPDLPADLKVPHIGWNALKKIGGHPLLKNVQDGARENVMGTQFHPEKSGNVGLGILRAFCETEGTA